MNIGRKQESLNSLRAINYIKLTLYSRKSRIVLIEEELQKLKPPSDEPGHSVEKNILPLKPTITIEDFQKVDLRVAKIIACESVPKSKKLLKLQVEIGTERRQIVAGIAQQTEAGRFDWERRSSLLLTLHRRN